MIRRTIGLVWCATIVFAVVGCGSSGPTVVPVEGIAVRHGKPVANLFINFMPMSVGKTGRPSWGQSDANGRFTLHYEANRDGAEIGKHRVFVRFRASSPQEELDIQSGKKKWHPDQRAIEQKYGSMESSPLEIEVTSAANPIRLELD